MRSSPVRLGRYQRELAAALAYAALLVLVGIAAPSFFRAENLRDLAVNNAPVLLAAIGMTLVILAGQIDISIGSQFAVCSVAAGLLARAGVPIPLLLPCVMAIGALMGGLNGVLVGWLRLPSIIVTLAMMAAWRDALRWATQGAWVQDLPAGFQWLGLGQTTGQWLIVAIALAVLASFHWMLRNLAAGRAIYAVGSDAEAARLAGIEPRRIVFGVFVLMGALVGLAALLNAVRFSAVPGNAGAGLELAAIAAVVVGGTEITGGRGTLAGTLIGAALLGTIGTALTFLGINPFWERAIQGAILLAALASDLALGRLSRFERPRRRGDQGDGATGRKDMFPSLTPSPRSPRRPVALVALSPPPAGPAPNIALEPPWRERLFPNHEWVLLLVLLFEGAAFSLTGRHFLSAANGFEITRLGVELGLLALALTPVILTGGIDLSVGSMMGLAAVVMGALWRDARLPMALAVACALLIGLLGGALNALMIARLRFPPLIVTLGTFSLFRGIAEGLTRGIENYSGFPAAFLFLGQGYVGGVIPTQLFLLIAAVAGCAWWLHRTAFGRSLYAIGYSAEGARYSGIPVARRLGVVYVLSGLAASLAAVLYVAHLGQAKSDAGTGYELMAITAVVLGGASIFGGRGTVLGTILGLFAIVILQNGLRLSAQPAELAGILTGVLLVATILLDRLSGFRISDFGFRIWAVGTDPAFRNPKSEIRNPKWEGEEVKNWQVAVLSAVILASAFIVVGGNWFLVGRLRQEIRSAAGPAAGPYPTPNPQPPTPVTGRHPVIALMPKAKGDPYFISCRQGAEEAAKEMGVELLWDGPTELDPAKQNEVVEAWITRGVDAIAVSVENKVAISTVLRKARAKGIKVLTWDADAEKDARDFFVNQATPRGIGDTLTDEAARILGKQGEFAIITASLSAANQNEWIKYIKERLSQKYPEMKLVAIQPSEGDRDRAFAETQTVLKVYPKVRLIMAIAAPAVPGAAEAVQQSGRTDVKVTGLSLPNMCKPYVHAGVIDSIVLWNTTDLGYLTVCAARALTAGELKRGARELAAGRLGKIKIDDDQVMLGAPFLFNKENIDRFNF